MELAEDARAALVAHAREGAPEEVCGVLVGRRDPETVTGIRRVENVADRPRNRYELDAGEQLAAMDAVEASGASVVGFYHSHPRGPAEPSATDERLATWDGYVYAVVSLGGDDPTVGAWRWTGERFDPVPVAQA